MTGEGMVISSEGRYASVRIFKESACSHDCSDCAGCEGRIFDTRVINSVGARPGDKVKIQSPTSKVLSLALLVYMLPVVIFILAALVCEVYDISPVGTVALFVLLALMWFCLIRITNRRVSISDTIVEILPTKSQKD